MPSAINIYLEQVPASDLKLLCSAFARAAEAFFQDPKNLADFEEWRRTQNN